MTDRDLERFLRALAALNLVYRPELTAEQQRVYFRTLNDLAIEDLEAGVERVLRTRTFTTPPTPGEIREQAVGNVAERGLLAWARVYGAAKQGLGGWTPITFEDPATHAAIAAMGGWRRLYHLGYRDTAPVDVATARRDFLEYHGIFAVRGVPPDTPGVFCDETPNLGRPPRVVPAMLGDVVPRAFPDEVPKALPPGEPSPELKPVVERLTERLSVRPLGRRERPARAGEMPPVTDAERAEHEARKRQALLGLESADGGDR